MKILSFRRTGKSRSRSRTRIICFSFSRNGRESARTCSYNHSRDFMQHASKGRSLGGFRIRKRK